MKVIPYGRQLIDDIDISEVVRVLKSDFLTQGPEVQNFEKNFSKFVSSRYAISSNSATSSLHIACMALNLGSEDLVWTSPNSYVASANCALYCGAKVDFIDIELTTFNIDIDKLELKLKRAKKEGTLPKIIIPVHFSGNSCDMEKIYDLSKIYKFHIIEDASHCVGANFNSKKIGSCEFSDACIFSFHPVKIMTTGEGGMITTNSEEMYKKSTKLRSHGVTKESADFINQQNNPWYFEQQILGFNYRMTDIAAALGSSQLKKVNQWVEYRKRIASKYDMQIDNPNVTKINLKHFIGSSHHLYVIRLPNKDLRDRLYNELRKNNILVNIHYIPIHLHPYFANLGFKAGMYPVCEEYYNTAISLPIFASLEDKDIQIISEIINNFS